MKRAKRSFRGAEDQHRSLAEEQVVIAENRLAEVDFALRDGDCKYAVISLVNAMQSAGAAAENSVYAKGAGGNVLDARAQRAVSNARSTLEKRVIPACLVKKPRK